MRRLRYFDSYKATPRMAWNARNLFNLWSRSSGPHFRNKHPHNITTFKGSSLSLFKQRWQSKKLVRAYHCDYIPEKKFIKWYLPERLPDPMATKNVNAKAADENSKWARITETKEERDGDGLAPISSLMFAELERRIDVVVFRSCFAHSIHAARQLVIHGKVTLNGIMENDPNVRLNPGDMISVNPDAMTVLLPPEPVEAGEPTADEGSSTAESSTDKSSEKEKEKSNKPKGPVYDRHTFHANSDEPAFRLRPFAAPFVFIPAYLEVSFATCSTVYVRHPTARPGYSEIPSPYDADGEIVRFAWEWYRKNRTRIRGGWKRAMRDRMEKGKSGWSGVERPLASR